MKCVRPHPSWLAWREEYYEGKCDCAGSSPASPICLHINYQLGPPLWKNMAEYKVNLGHPWKPLPPAERRKCEVKCDCHNGSAIVRPEYKVSSLGSSQLSPNHEAKVSLIMQDLIQRNQFEFWQSLFDSCLSWTR